MRIFFLFLGLLLLFGESQGQNVLYDNLEPAYIQLLPDQEITFQLEVNGPNYALLETCWDQGAALMTVTQGDSVLKKRTLRGRGRNFTPLQTDRAGAIQIRFAVLEPLQGEVALRRQEPLATSPEKRVDQIMAPYREPGMPGAQIAVVAQGQTVLAKGYGLANVEHEIPFTPSTLTDIGSLAKQFTAFAIALLAEDGQLSLDDRLRQYFPDSPEFADSITIRYLIHHTSGLREIYTMKAIAGFPREGIRQEEARELLYYSEALNFAPGSQFLYCNTSYMLLADIVEQVTDQRFESFMQERVFRPLGMTNTFIMDVQGETFPLRADSYSFSGSSQLRQVYDVSSAYGQGGIYTSMDDLVRWLNNLRTGQVGGSSVRERMTQRGVLRSGDTLDYAFGLFVDDWRGYRRIAHGGSSAGYRAYLAYFPEADLGILIKGNYAGLRPQSLADQLAKVYLPELQPKSNEPEPHSRQSEPLKVPTDQMDRLTGRYFTPELEVFYDIVRVGDQLSIKNRIVGDQRLIPIGKNRWKTDQGTITFFEQAGQIAGFRMDAGRVKRLRFVRQSRFRE